MQQTTENNVPDGYTAPALELVAKRLREEKNILVLPEYVVEFANRGFVCNIIYDYNTIPSYFDLNWKVIPPGKSLYNTYEEALSAGIDEAIKC